MHHRRRSLPSASAPAEEKDPDLTAIGLDLRRRSVVDPTWADRLRVAERSRRLLPARVAVGIVRWRAARRWARDSELREAAVRRARAVSPQGQGPTELEGLARATVLEDAALAELLERPWVIVDRRRLRGVSQLRDATAQGRGVVVSYCHLGPFEGASSSVLRATGRRPWLFAGTWIDQPPGVGASGRHVERWRDLLRRAGPHVLTTTPGTLARATALLEAGETVCFLFDVPGATVTPWLGRPVALASGTARMAFASGGLVVVMHAHRKRGRAVTTFHPAIDPHDFETPEALHVALAAAHERLIVADLAAFPDPRRTGAWELGVSAEGWTFPRDPRPTADAR